jgi:secreted trypsin-like serine protease
MIARRRIAIGVAFALGAATLMLPSPAGAIYGGTYARFASYRWMVSLRLASAPSAHICAGTLISADVVLTAAHCVDGHQQHAFVVVVGVDVPSWPAATKFPVLGFREPASFNGSAGSNESDIAVLRLAVSQTGPTIRLASAQPQVGAALSTAGWGCTAKPPACGQAPSSHLKVTDQTLLADSECGATVFKSPRLYAPTAICTKGTGTVNGGDSGGPLLEGNTSTGFIETGVTSLDTDNPSKLYASFTSVPREQLWIHQAIIALRAAQP